MKHEQEAEFFERFPFLRPEDMRREGGHIAVASGWRDLLWNLCLEIEAELKKDLKLRQGFRVVQIKEKFATLEVYVQGGNDEIFKATMRAAKLSGETCETCGKPGEEALLPGSYSWIITACPSCLKDMKERVEKESNKLKEAPRHQHKAGQHDPQRQEPGEKS
jgi:hypothetical protein